MKPTRFTFSKLRWLLLNPVFKEKPFSVIRRLLVWEWIRLMNRPVRATFDGSHSIVLRPNEGASRLTFYFGNSEPETFAFMGAYLKPGMCVIDVGANIGLNAIYAARRVGGSGTVLAIEPDPANFARIRENLGEVEFPQMELFEAACGSDSARTVTVHSNREDSSRSFVSSNPQGIPGGGVPVITIDEIVRARKLTTVDYLKIDVEGFEEHVLRGALQTIRERKVKILHIELDPGMLGREGSSVTDLVREIEELGLHSCRWLQDMACFQAAQGGESYYGFFVIPELIRSSSN